MEKLEPTIPQLFHEAQNLLLPEHADVVAASASGQPLIRARNDEEAIIGWLGRYDNIHTFSLYRKEAERFWEWCRMRGQTFAELALEDITEYKSFLLNPQPANIWVGKASEPRRINGVRNPNWRPFNGPLESKSAKLAASILHGLFEYLVDAGYLRGNPWRLVKKERVNRAKRVDRYLPPEARDALFRYVRTLAADPDPANARHGIRCYWIVTAFYLAGPRRSELATGHMGDLYRDEHGWWWRIYGKGDTVEDVPLTIEFLEVMQQYRTLYGLPPLPSPQEKDIPLVGDIYTGRRQLKVSAIYHIIKELCRRTAETIEDPYMKEVLMSASPHWLRHTAASDQVNVANLSILQASANLRHKDIGTTQIYLHTERAERFAATQRHKLPETD